MLQFKVDAELCVSCGECAAECPYLVIEMGGDGVPAVNAERENQCIGCQHCLAICPTGALSILGKDPADSLPLDGPTPEPEALERLVMGRRSVRRFKDEPVDPAVIERLLVGAAHAPTGVNNRQVLFTVVDDPEVMDTVRTRTLDGLRRAVEADALPKGLEFMAGFVKLWDERGVDILFRGAPHLLIASTPEGGPSPEADCHIALTTFELLAASRGVGTLWDGLFKWALTGILPEMLGELGIPEGHTVGYAMVFGLPAVKFHRAVQRADAKINRVAAL